MSLVTTKAWDSTTNVCTFTKTGLAAGVVTAMNGPGIVQVYGVDEIVEYNAAKRLSTGKYPFAGVLKLGAVDYTSAANVSGCESCHTKPYLKHAYIYGEVTDNDGNPTEFYTCKGCHYDNRNGGHVDWQILKDDPARYAEIIAGSPITDAEKVKYAYTANIMNDVHMSHAMEFAYPQSMKNCVTCHAGKLDVALDNSKFKATTCKSCHAVDGLKAIMSASTFPHGSILDNLNTTDCTICHQAGGAARTFSTIHGGGYDAKIYTTTGVRYSDTFVTTIDSTTIADNKLTIKFSATGSVGSLAASAIKPTVLVGLYGYNTKDFLVAAHGRDADNNRLLEYVVGTTHPRFTTVTAAGGSWEVTADLSMWADKIAAGEIKRAEIAVMPQLKDAAGTTLGLNAPSKTFDLAKNAFDDAYFKDIVDTMTGCNTCHDQLATTFHSGDRGGNIKVCRICHEVSSAGSHLELQSRSIDSYVHAIHSFQAFDPGNINFADPVESVAYEHHINSEFPRFGILNCESCHKTGMYDVPNQSKSMPGVLSGTDAVEGRNIGAIPSYVTGPAVRACGGCHRAQKINADDAGGLAVLNQHFKTFGYLAEDAEGVWEGVVAKIMAIFK
jgi:OmcA/MtrC family decaheme c-type cytochrome